MLLVANKDCSVCDKAARHLIKKNQEVPENFDDSDQDESDLDESDLDESDLDESDLDESDLDESDQGESDQDESDQDESNLDDSNSSISDFHCSDLDLSDLDISNLEDSDLDMTNLRENKFPEHICYKTPGLKHGMEVSLTLKAFQIAERYGVRFTELVSDCDVNITNVIRRECPYGVQKIDCMIHAIRTVDSHLQKVYHIIL
jgi:Pentapeptide repeats (8 copies)